MPDQTLAQSVRAKYPGVYDDLSDADLETKVKAKYPGAYDDLPTTKPAAAKTPDQAGFLSRAGEAVGAAWQGVKRAVMDQPPTLDEVKQQARQIASTPDKTLQPFYASEPVQHPIKSALRALNVNPDALYNDAKALNVPAVAGDLIVPAALAVLPKALRVGATEADAALARVKASRAVTHTAEANKDYFTNLGKAIGPTAKSPAQDVIHKTQARPYLAAEHAASPIETTPHVVEAADRAIGAIQGKVESYIAPFANEPIATNPLDAAESALKDMKGARTSDVAKGLAELDDLGLEQPPGFKRAFDLIYRLNAENKSILAKNNYDRATVRAQDPTFVAREAAVDALRDGVYDGLEAKGIAGVRQLRRDEGSLIAVRNAAQKQVFKGDQTIGGVGALGLPARIAAKGLRYGTGAATASTGYAIGGPIGGVAGVAIGGPLGEVLANKFIPRVTRNDLVKSAFKNLTAPRPVYPEIPAGGSAPPVLPSEAAAGSLPLEPAYAQAAQPVEAVARPVSDRGPVPENRDGEYPPSGAPSRLHDEGRVRSGALEGGAAAVPANLQAHFQSLVPFAYKHGFRGTIDQLAQQYADRVAEARTVHQDMAVSADEVASSHDLIKAISDAGGLGIEAEGKGGMRGELEHLLESLHKGAKSTAIVKRGPRAGQEMSLPPRQSGGIPGVSKVIVRKGGQSVDRVLEHLNQDPRFHFESMSDFLEALRHAVFEETQGTSTKGVSPQALQNTLAYLHVTPDEKWWEPDTAATDFNFGENIKPLGKDDIK